MMIDDKKTSPFFENYRKSVSAISSKQQRKVKIYQLEIKTLQPTTELVFFKERFITLIVNRQFVQVFISGTFLFNDKVQIYFNIFNSEFVLRLSGKILVLQNSLVIEPQKQYELRL